MGHLWRPRQGCPDQEASDFPRIVGLLSFPLFLQITEPIPDKFLSPYLEKPDAGAGALPNVAGALDGIAGAEVPIAVATKIIAG